jgi:nucleotide-binding universal stress UspA family protein
MYRRILVPLDGSRRAERILPHVRRLARPQENEVTLLQVVNPYVPVMDPHAFLQEYSAEEMEQILQQARSYLQELQQTLTQGGITCRIQVEQGPVVETIISVAQEHAVDLIAMASHGRGGLSRVFYGSVAAGILQRIDRPLLLIRARGDE